MTFRDSESAQRAIERLEKMTGLSLQDFSKQALAESPDPDLTLMNLERWLARTTNARMHLEQMIGVPILGRIFAVLLGASQPISDALVQNPELASLVLEPGELSRVPTVAMMEKEGRKLLASATSQSHRLDRLRFLRQRFTIPIVINDVSGNWSQETVWSALSDLAEVILGLTAEVVWADMRRLKDLPETCPVSIVAFGKFGGQELNYSSDIDLTYLLDEGIDEKLERECTRFCEALGRALSDRMGRGFLYRVDLRLRPYGGAGPIIRTLHSTEAYYKLYAEAWERQALLKARCVVGSVECKAAWEALRHEMCFRPKTAESTIQELLGMRTRIEEHASSEDLKRAPGGIRDVEFLIQLLQLLHGTSSEALQTTNTMKALVAAADFGLLDSSVRDELLSAYRFLRKLEHRCQLLGDQQTHELPPAGPRREVVARLSGFGDSIELFDHLEIVRKTLIILYRSTFGSLGTGTVRRQEVLDSFGAQYLAATQWFDLLPESEAFYEALAENEGSLGRAERILRDAPTLVGDFKRSLALTELLLSGEIEEEFDPANRLLALSSEVPLKAVAEGFARSRTRLIAAWALEDEGSALALSAKLSDLYDSLLKHCATRIDADFDVLGLGSYGNREPSLESDCDLLFLIRDPSQQSVAEAKAQELLALLGQLRRYGAPFEVDLRLRPEGGKGLLVRTYDALQSYDLEGMEMWERFALGHARPISASNEALRVVRHCAYGLPLTPERLRELVQMKKRVENERVASQHLKRQIKLGHGSLNDIEWLVHLHEMRYPTATRAGEAIEMPSRIRSLGRASLLNAVETERLEEAHAHLHQLRTWIALMGYTSDLLPENPDKLDRLAQAMGIGTGNDLLAVHEPLVESVRQLFKESLERLKV